LEIDHEVDRRVEPEPQILSTVRAVAPVHFILDGVQFAALDHHQAISLGDLMQAKISEPLIAGKIRNNGKAIELSVDQMVELKSAGPPTTCSP
jgi:hypothetical protein